MKGIKTLVVELGLLCCAGFMPICMAKAVTSQASTIPYHDIVERNVFDLRAQVVIAQEPTTKVVVLPKVTLTGITTLFERTIAFVTVASDRPGPPLESGMLIEGQVWRGIEVRKIDCESGTIQIVNQGERQLLRFETINTKPVDLAPRPSPRIPHVELLGPPLSPEEQAALIEIQREKYRQENNPVGNLLPPMEMTLEGSKGGGVPP